MSRQSAPWWEQILRGERAGVVADSVRRIAEIGSWGYGVGIKGRELAYGRGWLAVKRLPQPTICVGNITVGGTGKTPLVIRLAGDLLSLGLRPAILLRGYKRQRKSRQPVLVRDAKRITASVRDAGDEAMELSERLPGSVIGVGADRYTVGRFLLAKNPIDCFILDDGFQHHRLQRDINIVTLDANNPWGGGKLLPAGLLREPPEALRRADAVVLTRVGGTGPDRLGVVRAQANSFLKPGSCLLESRHEPVELISLSDRKALPLSQLRGREVLAVSAIGQPHSFEGALVRLGASVDESLRLRDHSGRARDVWQWIAKRQKPGQWTLMTEKDAVRWSDASDGMPTGLFALRMDLTWTSGQEHWRNLLKLIQKLVHER